MLQAANAIQLAQIACDKGDPTVLAEGVRQMHILAEDPHSSVFMAGLAYEHWATR